MIDTHFHPQSISCDIKQLLLENSNIEALVAVGTNEDDLDTVKNISTSNAKVYHSQGIHPLHVKEGGALPDAMLVNLQDSKCVAVGETGLDYYKGQNKSVQKESFIKHIKIAQEINKPVIVHMREATEDILAIISQFKHTRGVLHSFNGSASTAMHAISLGYYISFSGMVTFHNASMCQDAAKKIPSDYIMVETDSPYLCPHPHRGIENNPSYLKFVLQKIADLRNITLEQAIEITSKNARRLFSI